MQPIYIALRPFDAAANARRNVYVGDAPSGEAFGAGGVAWEPVLVVRPKLSIELFSLAMDGKVQTGKASFTVQLDRVKSVPRPRDLLWRGALVQIWVGERVEGAAPEADFSGYVSSAQLDTDTGRLSLTAEVTDTLIDRPLLSKTFGGGGGIDGEAGKRGVFLPAGFGRVYNIEPIWFDTTRNIGMIDGYGNCVAIDALFEGLNGFGARVADYPSYAALAAAIDAKTVAPGQWATCVAQGLVGLGAPPEKPITVHALFGANRPGLMMTRIAQVHAGVSAALIEADAFAALDVMVNRSTHFWTAEQRNCKDLIEAIARSCNATPLVSFQGRLTVTRAVTSLPLVTLDRTGNAEPRVLRHRAGQAEPPFSQLRARCARPARVLSNDEVNYVDSLVDRGLFSPTETYRAGNIVWLANGSQWLYTSAVPTAGNSPADILPPDTVGDYWTQMQPPKKASDFRYATGETIESLKPAERGANVTATNISAGFAGQGSLATRNFADWSSQVQGAGKPENGATVGAITGGNLQSGYGRGILTDDGIFTQLGISAGFAGQGALATRSYADWSTQVLGSGKPEDGATNDRGVDTRNDDFSPAYYRANYLRRLWTEFKALALFGLSGTYGSMETYAPWQDPSGGPVWQRITDNAGRRFIRYSISEVAWGPWQPEYSGNRRPSFTDGDVLETYGGAVATLGNFKTGLGTAAAIYGQGALATQSTAGWAQIVSVPTRLRPSPIFGESWLDISVLPYSNGAGVDSLRPQEAGANVTEFRVASAVAGQGAWATYAGVAPVTVAARVSRLQDDGYIYSSVVYNDIGSAGFLRDRWPQEFGANITESRVASGIAGQGALATRSLADWAAHISNRPAELIDGRIAAGLTSSGNLASGLQTPGYASVPIANVYRGLAGTNLSGNPEFRGGSIAGYLVYDNAASGRLSLAVVAAQDAPNGSGYVLRIRYAGGGAAGGPAPGFGGVVQLLLPSLGTAPTRPGYYQPGTTILCKIVALIPADKNLYFTSNAIGDAATGAAIEFLTSNAGTGDWQTYIVRLRIGRSGNFNSTGFLYVGDGSGAAFDWYLARYDQIDVASGSITFMGAGGLADEDGVPRYKADLLTQLGTAAAIAGQGSLATRSNITDGFLAGALAVRLQPHPLNTNYLGTDTIAYPGGAGVSALQPQEAGANVTESRVAAAIVGQGSGATASSLAQLDPSAASQLAAVAGGGVQVAALYEPIRKVMAPGATINFDAAAGISAGGDSGNVGLLIQVSLADANSWSNIAAGTERFVSASEPAYVTASGSFTNTSGAQRVYEFRAIDVRTPGSAGGGVVGSQSFLRG